MSNGAKQNLWDGKATTDILANFRSYVKRIVEGGDLTSDALDIVSLLRNAQLRRDLLSILGEYAPFYRLKPTSYFALCDLFRVTLREANNCGDFQIVATTYNMSSQFAMSIGGALIRAKLYILTPEAWRNNNFWNLQLEALNQSDTRRWETLYASSSGTSTREDEKKLTQSSSRRTVTAVADAITKPHELFGFRSKEDLIQLSALNRIQTLIFTMTELELTAEYVNDFLSPLDQNNTFSRRYSRKLIKLDSVLYMLDYICTQIQQEEVPINVDQIATASTLTNKTSHFNYCPLQEVMFDFVSLFFNKNKKSMPPRTTCYCGNFLGGWQIIGLYDEALLQRRFMPFVICEKCYRMLLNNCDGARHEKLARISNETINSNRIFFKSYELGMGSYVAVCPMEWGRLPVLPTANHSGGYSELGHFFSNLNIPLALTSDATSSTVTPTMDSSSTTIPKAESKPITAVSPAIKQAAPSNLLLPSSTNTIINHQQQAAKVTSPTIATDLSATALAAAEIGHDDDDDDDDDDDNHPTTSTNPTTPSRQDYLDATQRQSLVMPPTSEVNAEEDRNRIIAKRHKLLKDFVLFMQSGVDLIKHGRSGGPKVRTFYIDSGCNRLAWMEPGSRELDNQPKKFARDKQNVILSDLSRIRARDDGVVESRGWFGKKTNSGLRLILECSSRDIELEISEQVLFDKLKTGFLLIMEFVHAGESLSAVCSVTVKRK